MIIETERLNDIRLFMGHVIFITKTEQRGSGSACSRASPGTTFSTRPRAIARVPGIF
jgi:hypothetical protein